MQNVERKYNVYSVICWATSLLYFYLFVQLLAFPDAMLRGFGIEGSPGVHLLARRVAMLMLGFAVLVFLARKLPASAGRLAIATAVCVNMAGFASMGLFEFARGRLGADILVIVAIETTVAVSFGVIALRDRRQLS